MINSSQASPFINSEVIDMRRYLRKVFGWMSIGVFITFAVAFVFAINADKVLNIVLSINSGITGILAVAVQMGMIFYFHSQIMKMNPKKAQITFVAYSIMTGIDFSIFFIGYGISMVVQAFLAASLFFACLCVIGYTTKRDLTKIGTLCVAGLFGLVLYSWFAMIFSWEANSYVFALIGIALFIGITAWDMQNIKRMYYSASGDQLATESFAVLGAFELYIDFLNIFLYILQLFASSSDD